MLSIIINLNGQSSQFSDFLQKTGIIKASKNTMDPIAFPKNNGK